MSFDVVPMVNVFQINGFAIADKIALMELMNLNAVSIDEFSAYVSLLWLKMITLICYLDETCRADRFTCSNGRCIMVSHTFNIHIFHILNQYYFP